MTAQALSALARRPFPIAPAPRAKRPAGRRGAPTPAARPKATPRPRQAASTPAARAEPAPAPPAAGDLGPPTPPGLALTVQSAPASSAIWRASLRRCRLRLDDVRVRFPPLRIGVPTETAPGERRVALVPDIVRKLVAAGHEVVVEPGAGDGAGIPDADYEEAGATTGASGRPTRSSRSRRRRPRRAGASPRTPS